MRLSRSRLVVLALVSLVALLGVAACGDDDSDDGPTQVTFMAGFRAQANLPFVAVYIAQEKGFFAEEGLEVEIRHSGGGDEHLQLLLGNRVDFTTHLASSVLEHRTTEPQLPIRAFVLWGQRSPAGFMTLVESGIDSVEKFPGHRYGYKQRVTSEYLAMLAAAGVDRSSIDEVSVGFDPSIIVDGQVDILAVFLNNEPNVLRTVFGKEVHVFDPSDFGVAALGLTYIATEATINDRPNVVERFTRAALRGAEYAIANEAEAIDIVLQYMEAGEDARAHQEFLFREDVRQAQSTVSEEHGIGYMTLAQWEANAATLVEHGILTEAPDVPAAFTTRFLDAAR